MCFNRAVKLFLIITLIFGLNFWFASSILAFVNPLAVPNNRFGIHIVDQNDLVNAANLVNSSGGDWGYVTLVIRSDDQKVDKWQPIFNTLRRLHLIPLVRLATKATGATWEKPTQEEVTQWVNFLNQLNWVVQNRYVILFNEPNHAKEWGGDLKPNEYAQIFRTYQEAFKQASPDYFVLPAGLDAAADNSPGTMSLDQYYKFMHAYDADIFNRFDGWVTHAYPNPDFSGSLKDKSKMSLVSYNHELSLAKSLGLTKDLPIFITETGWVHQEGQSGQYGLYTATKVADLMAKAYTNVWTDPRIVAITPFLLNYQAEPFDHFSWVKPGGQEFYPQYGAVQQLPKTVGRPIQIESAQFIANTIPSLLVNQSVYEIPLVFKNLGQSIWNPSEYAIIVDGTLLHNRLSLPITTTEPNGETQTTLHLDTPINTKDYSLNFRLEHKGQALGDLTERTIKVILPPSLFVKAQVWYQKLTTGNDFTLLIYDEGNLLKRISPFNLTDGTGAIKEIRDVIPNRQYRFVLTKSYYLPRQVYAYLSPTETSITFARLLPFDLNRDGQLTLLDLWSALIHPRLTVSLLFHFS
jgi:hypothetical protein